MSDRITIDLDCGLKLVVERNTDPEYNRELFIGVCTSDGVWYQDLAVVRNSYIYDNDYDVTYRYGVFDVLVYADRDSEDYTERFEISLRTDDL